ncbi:MAG: RluA family pseudouridine synthase [Lachnospiraceae bacterium]
MSIQFQYTASDEDDGTCVGDYLRKIGYSKKLIIDLKKDPSYLTIRQRQVYVTAQLRSGDILQVRLPAETASESVVPAEMPLNIVYEDQDILVLNKDAGVPIHPSQGNYSNTLANGVAWYFGQQNQPFVYRVINRLDRDTTGLLILAKHALSACILSDMVRSRQIHRTYLAAVHGDMHQLSGTNAVSGLTLCQTGDTAFYTLSAPIARVCGSTIERQVNWEQGEYACTHFKLRSYLPESDSSLIELRLDTGRTHQIRVHMKYLGFPLYGDFLYYPDYRYINRQSLHSWKLDFIHPIAKEPLSFTAAVPDDMKCFLAN